MLRRSVAVLALLLLSSSPSPIALQQIQPAAAVFAARGHAIGELAIAVPAQERLTVPDPTPSSALKVMFQENFEDTSFVSRGWYDTTGGTLSLTEHIPGSAKSFECRFNPGATGCAGGTPGRHLFAVADNVYLDYWIKYSANYVGSGKSYHPHEFYFLTNRDGPYIGPAGTHLTTYVEQVGGRPRLVLQDALNVDGNCVLRNNGSFVGCNGNFSTYQFTESRSVASCNGIQGTYDKSDCFQSGSANWYSARMWDASQNYFFNEPNQWHHVQVYFQLNTIGDGWGNINGRLKYWLDDRLLISYDTILFRTAQNPTLKFNQLLIAPYIGDGSPVAQTMWIDDLTVATNAITRIVGDINNDAKVDILDLQLCVNQVLGIQSWRNDADVNGDGSVNALDVQEIINIILKS